MLTEASADNAANQYQRRFDYSGANRVKALSSYKIGCGEKTADYLTQLKESSDAVT